MDSDTPMAKNTPSKLKARLPRGFVDRSAADIRATEAMLAKIREVYERYGFDPVETPAFEYTDCLGKFLPDTDRPNAGVFSVQDDDEQWMSLRYDLTAPLARHVAENINEIQLPFRSYRAGWVFRNEKPGPGRFRQFMQFDADSVGAPGVQADAEMCMMMADTMEALGIDRGKYVIRVNNRKVLDGILEAGGVTDSEQKLAVLRAIDKLDKFGEEGVALLLGEGRKDESGDFTKGAGLDSAQIQKVLTAVFINKIAIDYASDETASESEKSSVNNPPDAKGYLSNRLLCRALLVNADEGGIPLEGYQELSQIADLVDAAGYGPDRIKIDPSVVRGLEYYTGPVYEAELLFDVTNEKGEVVQFGSVGGGGRYDGLVKRFTGRDVPATGFSIGVSRLMSALKNLKKLQADEVVAPVLVTVMDGDTESLARYQKFTQMLRNAKDENGNPAPIRAEMYQGNWKKFGNQLKYADRRGCPLAIIQGGDERSQGTVQIKDLIEGKRLSGEIADNVTWRESRPAQVSIPEADIVATVRRMLAEQAEDRARQAGDAGAAQ